ncbi:MAG: hypothetical protein M4579_004889 [Chaenotheca gracillima]|nr:MAG: hypothetical protein M4579_004889 [Chaenotheca gracillima]
MASDELTAQQLKAMVVTERVTSCLSIVSIFFILFTYLFASGFNKPINRLIFYASWGNLGVTVASLISEAGPNAGQFAPLCQFQAFMVQMFLGVDAFWACCMAFNVYLIFFRKYNTKQLRSLDFRYLFGCYGASFVPAFIYIFIDNSSRGKIYGPAIIWCWVTVEWDFLRILTLYGIVWIAILLALVIYGMAAKVLWQRREQLQGFFNPFNEHPFTPEVVTEVTVTHEENRSPSQASGRIGEDGRDSLEPYSVNVEVGPQEKRSPSMPAILRMRTLTRTAAEHESNADSWLYARVAFLFFFALLITWVPSSINRVYALVYPTRINFGLNYASSLVFPLQGFWNGIVYVITSQTAFRDLFSSIPGRGRSIPRHGSALSGVKSDIEMNSRFGRRTSQRLHSDIESTSSKSNLK